MSDLPSGTVTFLFTDIQSSTKMWQAHPHKMQEALHREIFRYGDYVFKTLGDAFFAAFHAAMVCISAAAAVQIEIRPNNLPIQATLLIGLSH